MRKKEREETVVWNNKKDEDTRMQTESQREMRKKKNKRKVRGEICGR